MNELRNWATERLQQAKDRIDEQIARSLDGKPIDPVFAQQFAAWFNSDPNNIENLRTASETYGTAIKNLPRAKIVDDDANHSFCKADVIACIDVPNNTIYLEHRFYTQGTEKWRSQMQGATLGHEATHTAGTGDWPDYSLYTAKSYECFAFGARACNEDGTVDK